MSDLSNNAIATNLSKDLHMARTTILRYLERGMPSDEAGAREWILAFKANKDKTRAPKAVATVYPTIEIEGDDSAARLQRMKAAEKSLAGQIAGIERETLPQLALQLHSVSGTEKKEVERKLFQAQQALLALRKESRCYLKLCADIELRSAAPREGLVSLTSVIEYETKIFSPVFAFLRTIDSEFDENTISKEIHRRLTSAIDQFITTLRNHEND